VVLERPLRSLIIMRVAVLIACVGTRRLLIGCHAVSCYYGALAFVLRPDAF
jgi:hypothetical protein